jgi:hypothetical protein
MESGDDQGFITPEQSCIRWLKASRTGAAGAIFGPDSRRMTSVSARSYVEGST